MFGLTYQYVWPSFLTQTARSTLICEPSPSSRLNSWQLCSLSPALFAYNIHVNVVVHHICICTAVLCDCVYVVSRHIGPYGCNGKRCRFTRSFSSPGSGLVVPWQQLPASHSQDSTFLHPAHHSLLEQCHSARLRQQTDNLTSLST